MKTAQQIQNVADLAWAGQHEQAIRKATAALERKSLAAADRMTLLDLRSESYIALGDLKAAAADAQAMKALAKRDGGMALLARALCRESNVRTRDVDPHGGATVAAAALKAAERSRVPELVALALMRLAAAQSNTRIDLPAAIRHATRAAAMFGRLGNTSLRSRALQTLSGALWASDQSAAARKVGTEALALARRCGDLFGQGSALNNIGVAEADYAQALRLFGQALDAYKAAGYVRSTIATVVNIGATYGDLGLYRRARRQTLEALGLARRAGARAQAEPSALESDRVCDRRGIARGGAFFRSRSRCAVPRAARNALPPFFGPHAGRDGPARSAMGRGRAPFRAGASEGCQHRAEARGTHRSRTLASRGRAGGQGARRDARGGPAASGHAVPAARHGQATVAVVAT